MLKKFRTAFVLAAALAVGAPAGMLLTAAPARAEAGKVSEKVGGPLKAAVELANKGQYPAALAKLKEADDVANKSAFEQFQISETYGFVYLKQKNYAGAAAAYDKSLQSGQLPAAQVNDRVKQLAQLYLQTRDFKKSVEYTDRWIKATNSTDPAMYALLGQGYYYGNDYKSAAAAFQTAVKNAQAAKQKVDENWLRFLQDSYSHLGNTQGMMDATNMLVRLYPNPDNWRILTISLKKQVGSDDNAALDLYRLMYELDLMNKADDYTEAAIIAIQAGVPGDAVRFMERGYSTKVLETGGDKSRSQRILTDAKKKAAEQEANLAKFEKEAATAKEPATDVRLGQVFLSYGQTDRAIAAARRAIQKGASGDAYMLLGRAYLQQRNGAEARKAFAEVKDKNLSEIARLWSIRASQV